METFKTIRWLRVIFSVAIGLIAIAFLSFQYVKDAQKIGLDIGCIVRFSPDGTSEIIPFGDVRCPQ